VKLESVRRGSWRCEPTVGAFLVSRVVWAADGELLVDDLERMNPLAKRLQITKDDDLILEVHCMLNGAQDTSVDFLIPDGLSAPAEAVSRRLVAGAIELAALEHLVQRPLGFGR
jgi:hypothetical protein